MRDLETMKNPTKRMYDKFLNKFDKYIYDLVKAGYAYSVHGSIKESGFQYSNVMLTDEIKKEYKERKGDEEYQAMIDGPAPIDDN